MVINMDQTMCSLGQQVLANNEFKIYIFMMEGVSSGGEFFSALGAMLGNLG